MAGSLAFKDGMSRARPTLLEPVMTIEVYAPNDSAGDLMGDLNGRRGRISGMETRGHVMILHHSEHPGTLFEWHLLPEWDTNRPPNPCYNHENPDFCPTLI